MDAEHAPRVLPRCTGLTAEARRVPRVTERHVVGVQNLGAVHRRERDLGRSDAEELVPFDRIDVHLVGREEPGPVHRLLANEHRRQNWGEAATREPVESEPVERELEQRDVAAPEGEAGAGDLRTTLEVDARGGELQVVLDGKVERRRIAPAADLHGVVLSFSVGRRLVRWVRDPVEQLLAPAFGRRELLLQRLQLGLDALELLELLGRRFALDLSGRTELLDTWLDLPDPTIGLEQLVEDLGRSLPRERRPEGLRIVAGGTEIDHVRESRYASST